MRYFVTWGNNFYSESKQRIEKEAQQTGAFDGFFIYGPEDLSTEVKNNPIYNNKRGAGYWIWKPNSILKALDSINENDILVYVDCGSSLYPSKTWEYYFNILSSYELIAFYLGHTNREYTKRSVIDLYNSKNGLYWKELYQIAAAVVILKKTNYTYSIIKEWADNFTPEMTYDPPEDEMAIQYPGFIEHRYDQSIYSAVIYKNYNRKKIKLLTDDFGYWHGKQPIFASRISNNEVRGETKSVSSIYFIKHPLAIIYKSLRIQFFMFLCKVSIFKVRY